MTEEEARAWIHDQFGAPGTAAMETLVACVRDEAERQNLVASSTLDSLWARHVVDSAQLLALADRAGEWLDIGTGAGFPGMVIAALSGRVVHMVEPRRKRGAFLVGVSERLGIKSRANVIVSRIEVAKVSASVISARAFTALDGIFEAALHAARKETLWLLPKGKSAAEEIASAQQKWHGSFHVEHSITDSESLIILARKVSRR